MLSLGNLFGGFAVLSVMGAGAKGKQAGKNSGDSNVAKMWGKAPPKAAKKQGSKSDEQPAKKAKVEPAPAVSVSSSPLQFPKAISFD